MKPFVDVIGMTTIPTAMIKAEVEGVYGASVLRDMAETIGLYKAYDDGVEYDRDKTKDYIPADLKYKTIKALIDKEARFLFSKPPDIYVDVFLGPEKEQRDQAKQISSVYQDLVDKVLEENQFNSALLKAAKDCFIGKRVALMYNINPESGIQLSFLPSLEFVYDVAPNDANKLTKIIAFYNLNDEKARSDQRIYKKKYWLKEDGYCWYLEQVYDGTGSLVEEIQPETKTLFTFIPAWVIINDGLTGDLIGSSEVKNLGTYESWYSRLASADMDAERKGMNPIRYTIDASPESTKDLSISAGAFWDLVSDQNQAIDKSAQVGVLDSPMTYSSALSTTLDRIKNMMYEQSAVPNVSSEALKGVVSSGKTLKAIYWDLIVRCDEKMLAWRPALQFAVKCIIEGARLYPEAAKKYLENALPEEVYTVRVDNQYSLPEDEQEEKQVDLAEVAAQTMSKKAYMKKWRNLTEDEATEELKQIALEREMLENSFSGVVDSTSENETNESEDETQNENKNPLENEEEEEV